MRTVRRSIAALSGVEQQLTEAFFEQLFAMLPQVRELLPEEPAERRVRLLGAMLTAAKGLHQPEQLERELQALGALHHSWGITAEQLQYVPHALVRALREVLADRWSSVLSSAWIGVFSWIVDQMAVGARRAQGQSRTTWSRTDLPA
ncbi:MAG TPA: globin domain-containing protein [Kineosporiaceae bacterium]|nr:globin domain-containing protein [Kineosporiaceae bacterium]